ncbi:MAG: tetratricopeptide repeat protein, partial [Phycisphaerales bacterium]
LWNSPAEPADRLRAERLLREAAEGGDPSSMINLGSFLIAGAFGDRDATAGMRLIETAAEEGSTDAMRDLARRFHEGDGVEKDEERSRRWLHKLARTGNEAAILEAAERDRTGRGGPIDKDSAFAWLELGAERGSPACMREMANLYDWGLSPEGFNKVKATEWYRKAAEAGDRQAMLMLSMRLDRGRGVVPDPVEATHWLARFAEEGDGSRTMQVASRYDELGDEFRYQAAEWYLRAGREGHAAAWLRLADECRGGGIHVPVGKFAIALRKLINEEGDLAHLQLDLYIRAANLGSPEGSRRAAEILLDKHPERAAKALTFLTKAAEAGDIRSMPLLADMYLNARATPAEPERARQLLETAARAGNFDAAILLADELWDGARLTRDRNASASWYRHAVDLHRWGVSRLGRDRLHGERLPQDLPRAELLLTIAAEAGCMDAAAELAKAHMMRGELTPNFEKAERWARIAFEQGDSEIGLRLAAEIRFAKGPEAAVPMYERVADHAAKRGHDTERKQAVGLLRNLAREGIRPAREALRKRNLSW